MKRLLEQRDPSLLIQRAQELIGAAEPIDISPARGARIRRELDRPVAVKAALWTRLPAVAVAGFVLLFGASSFAALRLWSFATQPEPPAAAPEQDAADSSPGKPKANRRASAPSTPQPFATDTAPVLPTPAVRPQPSAAERETRSSRSQRSSRRVNRTSERARETVAPAEPEMAAVPAEAPPETTAADVSAPLREQASSPNSELVVRAVRALRRENDPARAARLLDEYRALRETSPLREEVLALQIEAAVANGDPRAARFAREYLTRYPAGRYVDTARRALEDRRP